MSQFKTLTAEKLKQVKNHPFYQKLLTGNITEERYAFYLWDQSYRYGAIEDWLADTTVFQGMEALKTYDSVRDDFRELWQTKMGKNHMPQPSRSATDMAKRLKEIREDDIEDTMQGLAHVWAMHGDLLELSKSLDLSKLPGSNTMFQWTESVESLQSKLEAKMSDAYVPEINNAYDLKLRMFDYLMDIDINAVMYDNKADVY